MAADVGATAALSVATQGRFEATNRVRSSAMSREDLQRDIREAAPPPKRDVKEAPPAKIDGRAPNIDLASVLAAVTNSATAADGLVEVANNDVAAFVADAPATPAQPTSAPIVVQPSSAAADDFPPTTPLQSAAPPEPKAAPVQPAKDFAFSAAASAYSGAASFTASASKGVGVVA